jgi:hypothetical protein
MGINDSEVQLRYSAPFSLSGGTDPSSADQSLGVFISTTQFPAGISHLFSNVTADENASAKSAYRCFFLANTNPDIMLTGMRVWIASVSDNSDVSLGLDPTPSLPINSPIPQAVRTQKQSHPPEGLSQTVKATANTILALPATSLQSQVVSNVINATLTLSGVSDFTSRTDQSGDSTINLSSTAAQAQDSIVFFNAATALAASSAFSVTASNVMSAGNQFSGSVTMAQSVLASANASAAVTTTSALAQSVSNVINVSLTFGSASSFLLSASDAEQGSMALTGTTGMTPSVQATINDAVLLVSTSVFAGTTSNSISVNDFFVNSTGLATSVQGSFNASAALDNNAALMSSTAAVMSPTLDLNASSHLSVVLNVQTPTGVPLSASSAFTNTAQAMSVVSATFASASDLASTVSNTVTTTAALAAATNMDLTAALIASGSQSMSGSTSFNTSGQVILGDATSLTADSDFSTTTMLSALPSVIMGAATDIQSSVTIRGASSASLMSSTIFNSSANQAMPVSSAMTAGSNLTVTSQGILPAAHEFATTTVIVPIVRMTANTQADLLSNASLQTSSLAVLPADLTLTTASFFQASGTSIVPVTESYTSSSSFQMTSQAIMPVATNLGTTATLLSSNQAIMPVLSDMPAVANFQAISKVTSPSGIELVSIADVLMTGRTIVGETTSLSASTQFQTVADIIKSASTQLSALTDLTADTLSGTVVASEEMAATAGMQMRVENVIFTSASVNATTAFGTTPGNLLGIFKEIDLAWDVASYQESESILANAGDRLGSIYVTAVLIGQNSVRYVVQIEGAIYEVNTAQFIDLLEREPELGELQPVFMRKIARLKSMLMSNKPVVKGVLEVAVPQPGTRAEEARLAASRKLDRLKKLAAGQSPATGYRFTVTDQVPDRLQELLDKRSQVVKKLERLAELAPA